MSRHGIAKRLADVPRVARQLRVSKADLLEVAWSLAGLSNDAGSVDDDESTLDRLREELNVYRAKRGAQRLRVAARTKE